MDFEMVSVREESTLAAVLAYLRRFDSLPDHSDKVFVVDRHGHFKGTLLLTKILVSDPDSLVRDLMQQDTTSCPPPWWMRRGASSAVSRLTKWWT